MYMRAFCENDQQDWPTLISLVELCYNTTVSRTTGKTPFYLCYGQEVVLASDLSVGQSEFTRDQKNSRVNTRSMRPNGSHRDK